MSQLIAIAAGGALGALMRYGVSTGVHGLLGRGFPYGTLAVNLVGCWLMGLLYVLLLERMSLGPEWRGALLIGLLGAFTTFSAFALETLTLIEAQAMLRAALNVSVSVCGSLLACWLGIVMARGLWA